MNVFYTNHNPLTAAAEHCRRHQIKMILEYAQLLSCAHHVLDGEQPDLYKKTHENHPSAKWVRESHENYRWVLLCGLELCRLYNIRTGKTHKTAAMFDRLCTMPANIPMIPGSNPPVAAPDEFKAIADTCTAYQRYLVTKFNEWLSRDKPLDVVFDSGTPDWMEV